MNEDIEKLLHDYSHLKALHESANKTIEELQKKVEKLENENAILIAEKKQWEVSKIMQTQIIQQSIDQSNTLNQQYVVEIQRLKDIIRKLRNK